MSSPSTESSAPSVNYRRMATFVATVIASIGAMNWGCQAMGCNLVEKIMPRGAVKPTYIIIALFGLVALVLAVLTYYEKAEYKEHYIIGADQTQYSEYRSNVSDGTGSYVPLGGMN
jgi:uncharacterized membrane protein YuzA (DUF378 family)